MKNDTRRCFYVGGGIQQSLPGWQNGDIDMKKKQNGKRVDKGISLLLSIVLVFGILGVVVFLLWDDRIFRIPKNYQGDVRICHSESERKSGFD